MRDVNPTTSMDYDELRRGVGHRTLMIERPNQPALVRPACSHSTSKRVRSAPYRFSVEHEQRYVLKGKRRDKSKRNPLPSLLEIGA